MEPITLQPIAVVRSTRREPVDDAWDSEECCIELLDPYGAECFAGLDTFSHAEIIFHFHRVSPDKVVTTTRRPRHNPAWPEVGIFAQRNMSRPNRLGLTVVRIRSVDGRRIYVDGLDAIDGTPVLDIKPWVREFSPRGEIRQPDWATELMAGYWSGKPGGGEKA